MDDVRRIVRFRGGVSCRREDGPLGLTLIGRTTLDEVATLAFAATAPASLPEALEDATVEEVETGRYRIWSGRREWIFPAHSIHLHREVATTFYRAIPARLVPWKKRLFWNVVLSMAASRLGKRLLLMIRGHRAA